MIPVFYLTFEEMLRLDNGFKKQGRNVLAVFELLRKTAISQAL
jgi:hypothetical protein